MTESDAMRDFLGGTDVAFLRVSSPKPEALEESFEGEPGGRIAAPCLMVRPQCPE